MDLVGRGSEYGAGIGFFAGCGVLIRQRATWYRLRSFITIGAIAATFAAGGAAMGIVAELIIELR
jgi:hypothetical protein